MTTEKSGGFAVLGKKITKIHVLVALVILLTAFNLRFWSLSRTIPDKLSDSDPDRDSDIDSDWHKARFVDSVALTQNAFENLFNEFEELLAEETLREGGLQGLEEWVEKTSIHSAKVTFLDRRHFDLWDRISDALELFEKLLEDLRVTVRTQSVNGESIPLDGETRERLQSIYDDLEDAYCYIFPSDTLVYGTIWEIHNQERMYNAFTKLERCSEKVAVAWLIIPTVIYPTAESPEAQARATIMEAVGEDYFERYCEFRLVEYNIWEPESWLTHIFYLYHISVGDYNATREIHFHFDKLNNMISVRGIPQMGDLMSFNITSAQAIEIASSNISGQYVEVHAEIYYVEKMHEGPIFDRYLWCVDFYRVPSDSRSGSATRILVDPISGEVLGVEDYGWTSM